MYQNKAAPRVLAHPNGQSCELTQIHNHILLHVVRFGKVFCKTCAVMLALLGLAALAALPTATVSAVLTLIGAIAALNWVCGAWFTPVSYTHLGGESPPFVADQFIALIAAILAQDEPCCNFATHIFTSFRVHFDKPA